MLPQNSPVLDFSADSPGRLEFLHKLIRLLMKIEHTSMTLEIRYEKGSGYALNLVRRERQ